MAEVERTKDKIIVTCECGAVIKITKNAEGEYKSSSTFKKKEVEKPEKPAPVKKEYDPFFDDKEEEEEGE